LPDAPPQPLDVARVTAAMARGDASAAETFYRACFRELYAEARHVTRRDEAFCLDVVQDSLLRILRTVRPVESRRQLAAWLKLVVRTTAYDLLRRERRRKAREQLAVESRHTSQADAEQLRWLQERLREIDPRIAELIELRFTQRWTLARIADRTGLTTAMVDGRLRRALGKLRAAALEEFDE
jgi:RNA polymerase sigma factor (sigma-70 family)